MTKSRKHRPSASSMPCAQCALMRTQCSGPADNSPILCTVLAYPCELLQSFENRCCGVRGQEGEDRRLAVLTCCREVWARSIPDFEKQRTASRVNTIHEYEACFTTRTWG